MNRENAILWSMPSGSNWPSRGAAQGLPRQLAQVLGGERQLHVQRLVRAHGGPDEHVAHGAAEQGLAEPLAVGPRRRRGEQRGAIELERAGDDHRQRVAGAELDVDRPRRAAAADRDEEGAPRGHWVHGPGRGLSGK
jgi:hypothetical protein